jgi:Dockerin type I domain
MSLTSWIRGLASGTGHARRTSRPASRSRYFHPRLECLEDRSLLSAFATIPGELATPREKDVIRIDVRAGDFSLRRWGVQLGFEMHAVDGSQLDPGRIQVQPYLRHSSATPWSWSNNREQSVTLATVRPGSFQLVVGGDRRTTGDYQVSVFLVGDANGDSRVDKSDVQLIHALRGKRLGKPGYLRDADANRDGVINATDEGLARANSGAATRIRPLTLSASIDPATVPSGVQPGAHADVNIVGQTLPYAKVQLDQGADGSFELTAVADAQGQYQFTVGVSAGTTQFQVLARGPFSQQLTAQFDVFVPLDGAGDNGGEVARLEIQQTGLLLTQTGDTKQLSAVAFDAKGNVIEATITWTSTKPDAISVDNTGKVTAATANGSSQVVAEAAGVKSAPLLVTVTAPAAGAILLTDAQIAGDPVETDPTAVPSFNNTYQVVLRGIGTPAIGSILINTESKAVAGRVVAVDTTGGQTTVTLGLVSIRELFPNLNVSELIDLSQAPVAFPPELAATYDIQRTGNTFTFTPKLAAAPSLSGEGESAVAAAIGTRALPPFSSCETTITGFSEGSPLPIGLSAPPLFSVTISPALDLVYTSANGLERFVVSAEPTIKVEGGLSVTAAFEGKIECTVDLFTIRIPVGGPLSFVIGGLVPVGIGLEASGKVTLATLSIGTKVETKAKAEIGLACPGGTNCEFVKSLGDFSLTATPKIVTPSLGNLRVEPSLAAFGFVKAAIGNPFLSSLRFDAFKAKAGGKLVGSFAPEISQIIDTTYKSNYQLSLEASAGVGANLSGALRLLGLSNVTALGLVISTDLAKSPTGLSTGAVSASIVRAPTSDSTDPARFQTGDTVNFTVKLDPTSINFLGLYNVGTVLLVRNSGSQQTEVGRVTASDGQTDFDVAFTAPGPGSISEFTAFAVTTLLPLDILSLEIGAAQPTTGVTVSVQPGAATLAPGATQEFSAAVLGTSNVNVTWTATGGTITPTGFFTAGQNPGTFEVKATSVADSSRFATASVTVTRGRVIQGTVNIFTQEQLTDLAGVTEITKSLNIRGAAITSLAGLESLTRIGGDLTIEDTTRLQNLDALAALTSVRGLFIENNTALTSIGRLRSVIFAPEGSVMVVEGNAMLGEVSFSSSISGSVFIEDNPQLTRLDLGLANAVGQLFVTQNGDAGSGMQVNLKTLNAVFEFVLITSNKLVGLAITGGIVHQDFSLDDNSGLTNLDGISSNLALFNRLFITGNRGFTDEHANQTADRLNVPRTGGFRKINSNSL